VVSTGHARDVTETSATLAGTVDPKGQATSYFFQYGTTSVYGSQTAVASAGSGTTGVHVSAAIGPLTPNTTYHYRLVASNVNGTTDGHDISFKTGRPPAGVTIAAVPGTITFGQVTSLRGQVLPPRPSQLIVALQSAPRPGGPWVTAATTTPSRTGTYAFSGLAPSSSTYYRAVADGVDSAPALVSVRFRVTLLVSRSHPPAGSLVRFHGGAAPGHRGRVVLVRRLGPLGRWHTIGVTRLRGTNPRFSFYSVKLRVRRSGRYRVTVLGDATHLKGHSRTVRIRVR
jgi:hypothetical protein